MRHEFRVMNGRATALDQRRVELVAAIGRMTEIYPQAAGAMFSGPWIEVFFEGWAKTGFGSRTGHYWRRRPGDRVLSLCGLSRALEYTIRGQVMIFEVGSFPKCRKCRAKRGGR